MQAKFTIADGKALIEFARKNIEYFCAARSYFREQCPNKQYMEKRGVFVTINAYPSKELRGCIGFPYPVKALWNAVAEAAIEAAFHDPRFPALQANELDKIVIEISILTMPEEIVGEKGQLPDKIEIGKDGLIVQRMERSGLLLPQVAGEFNWNALEFLEHTCEKAFLPRSAWRDAKTAVFKFHAQVFREAAPKGMVVGED